MDILIGVTIGLLIVCWLFAQLTGRDESKHQSRAQHYKEAGEKDAAARRRLDAQAARERRADPDAPENMFKGATAYARTQAAAQKKAYQLQIAQERRAAAEAKRQEATEKRRAAADKRRAKAAEARAKERDRAKRDRAKAKAKEKREQARMK
jgi:hypothetical protein